MSVKIGDIVHYVLNNGPGKSKHRPAIVVEVQSATLVDLQVFSNGTRGDHPHGDCLPNVFRKSGAVMDDSSYSEGTWHFPEKE